MSGKRCDSKGWILKIGESQKKDGRYANKYTDTYGKTQLVYTWKLISTDKSSTGKWDNVSLCEKVEKILRDFNDVNDTLARRWRSASSMPARTAIRKTSNVEPRRVYSRSPWKKRSTRYWNGLWRTKERLPRSISRAIPTYCSSIKAASTQNGALLREHVPRDLLGSKTSTIRLRKSCWTSCLHTI